MRKEILRKEIKPPVAVAIIVVVVLVVGFFAYNHAFKQPKPMKPAEMLAQPGLAQELSKRYQEKYGTK